MKPGDLVKITRPSIGVPKDSIGLITEHHRVADLQGDMHLFVVQLTEHPEYGTQTRRYLSRDLEGISESR